MTNDLKQREPQSEPDDGFDSTFNSRSGDINKGTLLKWTDAGGWIDRDGLTPPPGLLVLGVDTALQMWKENHPKHIRDKPLPDPEELNAAIPKSEWEKGMDGQLRKPWSHIIVVYVVNPHTGEIYTYTSPTVGAHIAFDALREAVVTMRALRGQRVMPVINLSEKPMKTNFGMRKRPHFEIIGWKAPGGDDGALPPQKPTPQLTGPTEPPKTAPSSGQPYQAKPKAPVTVAGNTLKAMDDVKPITTEEIMDDEMPWA
jgi:hypothetical protein